MGRQGRTDGTVYGEPVTEFRHRLAALTVSGECAMVEAAAERGWIDREPAIMEALTAIRRAGASVVLTYWATEAAHLLR